MMAADPQQISAAIKNLAAELGFDDCRIASAAQAPHADAFFRWLEDGRHGDMTWMARDPGRRADPRLVLPGCASVIVLAVNYFPGDMPPAPPAGAVGAIARYAWNDDYHDLILEKLKQMDAALRGMGGTQRPYVDTGPVLERDFAHLAGLGWNGKSTVQIHPKLGTWFFLAVVLTTLEAAPDEPARDRCGKCMRCIDACPTGAITAPHQLDARLCIAYLTIELKGSIPEALRPAIGNRIYGCDECLAVCPWNRFARASRELAFHARPEIFQKNLSELLCLDDEAFRSLFRHSPVKRLKLPRLRRNVAVALGNTGTPEDLPALEAAAGDPDPLVAEHAAWAVRCLRQRHGL